MCGDHQILPPPTRPAPGDCVDVAQACLYEEEEVHHECVHQIPLCLPYNTQVVNFVLCTANAI